MIEYSISIFFQEENSKKIDPATNYFGCWHSFEFTQLHARHLNYQYLDISQKEMIHVVQVADKMFCFKILARKKQPSDYAITLELIEWLIYQKYLKCLNPYVAA